MGKAKETNVTHAPIRQSVHVDCPPEDAFRLFTEGFGEWWPLASFSVGGDDSEYCAVEPWVGGKVFERTQSGEEHDWGTVTVWDPPDRIEFTWHPGEREDHDETVTVDFRVEADGTRVTLTHRNWHGSGVATCASHFARFVSEQLVAA
ncbi:MAG TPA: SRPBCC domain-containing protein [Bryobacteraceae bacterium]|jgi:uncharacterized protein YndB with AHSA1/START domain